MFEGVKGCLKGVKGCLKGDDGELRGVKAEEARFKEGLMERYERYGTL